MGFRKSLPAAGGALRQVFFRVDGERAEIRTVLPQLAPDGGADFKVAELVDHEELSVDPEELDLSE